MSILDSIIETGMVVPRITIFGKPGVGKTTLANQFPNPLFLFTEKSGVVGLKGISIDEGFAQAWQVMKGLLDVSSDEFPYKTIVIDSLTKLDSMVIDYIISQEKDPKKATISSACGGYGKGIERAADLHRAFKAMCDKWQDRGVVVIYIAHTSLVKDRMPDTEDFEINSLEMHHNKSRMTYINDVDAVFFARQKSYVESTESGKTIIRSTPNRVLVTGLNDNNVSKNRFAMPAEIDLSFEAIAEYIPFYNNKDKA